MTRQEIAFTAERLRKLLSGVDRNAVLIGGQALAFWAEYYRIRIDDTLPIVSKDADFLGDRALVERISEISGGHATYPPRRAITALVGQVTIELANDQFLNVDVLHKVVGIKSDSVKRRAEEVVFDGLKFMIMHPIDVLQSRISNLATLKDKQNEMGILQAKLAVKVAYRYIAAMAKDNEKLALKAIEKVVDIAKGAEGRRAASFGVDMFSAIPARSIGSEEFHRTRWPRLRDEMRLPRRKTKSGKLKS
ncbi:hypothetical protein KJZ71_05435 [Patescibacteria group bacterium]|nr:hypothetical protein [Patescibacteria group bacterium]